MQNHRSATLLNTSRSSSDDLPEYVEAAAREIYTALSTFLRSPTIINPVSGEGCDRASAKDFHEIRAVFTRGVA